MKRFEYEGETFLQFGLLQIAANPALNGYRGSDPWWWSETPTWHEDVLAWVKAHPGVKPYDIGAFGPPGWRFPTRELADEFLRLFDPYEINDFSHPKAVSKLPPQQPKQEK